jgi:PadR family transcriptional regulator, regulatory protein PadR
VDERTWPGEWLRGVLTLCILGVIAGGETYGYAIAQRLRESGLGRVKGGTLYPLLNRLEEDGLVRSRWLEGDGGPGRKAFAITAAGRDHLRDRTTEWQTFTQRATQLITTGSKA